MMLNGIWFKIHGYLVAASLYSEKNVDPNENEVGNLCGEPHIFEEVGGVRNVGRHRVIFSQFVIDEILKKKC